MKRRLFSVILFAMLAALASSTLIYKMIAGSTPQPSKPKTVSVLVATHDLEAGAAVAADDLTPVDWPAVDGQPWIGQSAAVVGRALLAPVAKGEPFSESRLAAKGSDGSLASKIPPGMRVVAVHVDELTGLSKFIFPGMHVDVISTGASASQNGEGIATRTILQNIEVLSSGETARDPKEKATPVPVFDLIVTPRQAEVLSQAVAQTRIQLVLRNPLDTSSYVAELLPKNPPPRPAPKVRPPKPPVAKPAEESKVTLAALPPPPPPAMPTVEVIHGARRAISAVAPAEPHK